MDRDGRSLRCAYETLILTTCLGCLLKQSSSRQAPSSNPGAERQLEKKKKNPRIQIFKDISHAYIRTYYHIIDVLTLNASDTSSSLLLTHIR